MDWDLFLDCHDAPEQRGVVSVKDLFPTSIYFSALTSSPVKTQKLLKELRSEIPRIRDYDIEGQRWSKENYLGGYTSYSSLSELHQFSSTFAQLKLFLDKHVMKFAKELNVDLKNNSLEMTQMWVNVMPAGVCHSGHLHPLSSISGTFYVDLPKLKNNKSCPLKFEDPRLAAFMGSVPRLSKSHPRSERFYNLNPKEGAVVLFESWLRHEVPPHSSKEDRVSISFNYNWF